MFFLRSIISDEIPGSKLMYDYKNELKLSGPAVNDKLDNVVNLFSKTESAACIESAKVLNETILFHSDLKIQRLCLTFILKSIEKFKKLHE